MPTLANPSIQSQAEAYVSGTILCQSISPSSPESEAQSGSLIGMSGAATAMSLISDEPIPPPSPFDQPSTSKEFPIKVIYC